MPNRGDSATLTTRERGRKMNCKQCKTEVHPYAIFPGEICVECYAKTEEANRPITAKELAQMWGAK